jgi:hypothetical protein
MNSKAIKLAITTALTSALVACGGGGDSTSSFSAEGIWGGSLADGTVAALIVLDDGEAWGAYDNDSTGSAGVLRGTLTASGSAVSGSLRDLSFLDLEPVTVPISGTAVTGSKLNLLIRDTTPLNMTYDASYDSPANLATLAGTYEGSAMSPNGSDAAAIVVLTSDGAIRTRSRDTVVDCAGSGSVALRNSSKAIVNFSLTFRGQDCPFADGTPINGVAQVIDGTLVMIGVNSAQTQGLIILGDKPAS